MHRSLSSFPARLIALCAVTVVASGLGAQAAPPAATAAAPQDLTLEKALTMAQESNAGLRAMRQRVEETERRDRVMSSNFLPRVATTGGYVATDNSSGALVPAGSFGSLPGLGPFPPTDQTVPMGGNDLVFAMTTVMQPVTQYFQIRHGVGASRADREVSRAELRRTEQAVALGVTQAYAGVLIAGRRREVARERVAAAALRSTAQTTAAEAGLATSAAATEGRLRSLQARQEELAAENELADLSYRLADALGLPAGTPLSLQAPESTTVTVGPLEGYLAAAQRTNPDVREAEALVTKTSHGVGAARAAYIPQVGLFGGHFYQSAVPFIPRNTLLLGAMGSWTILDFGARRNTLAERRAQASAADANLDRVQGRVQGDVEEAYRKVARAQQMLALAREALDLRTEALRMRGVQVSTGLGVEAEQREASAERMEAALDVLRAEMGLRIAVAELELAAGRLAR